MPFFLLASTGEPSHVTTESAKSGVSECSQISPSPTPKSFPSFLLCSLPSLCRALWFWFPKAPESEPSWLLEGSPEAPLPQGWHNPPYQGGGMLRSVKVTGPPWSPALILREAVSSLTLAPLHLGGENSAKLYFCFPLAPTPSAQHQHRCSGALAAVNTRGFCSDMLAPLLVQAASPAFLLRDTGGLRLLSEFSASSLPLSCVTPRS